MGGNVFLSGAKPSKHEQDPLVVPGFDPGVKLVEKDDGYHLELAVDETWGTERTRSLVTTEFLGKAKIPDAAFEQPDGTPYRIDTDYFGNKRDADNPFPGPFEVRKGGKKSFKVWPRKK